MSDGLWSEEETPPEREVVEKETAPRLFGGATKGRRKRNLSIVPDAASDIVIAFTEMARCASCGRLAPAGPAPMRHKATEWLALAADHAPDCRWIATRGYTDK